MEQNMNVEQSALQPNLEINPQSTIQQPVTQTVANQPIQNKKNSHFLIIMLIILLMSVVFLTYVLTMNKNSDYTAENMPQESIVMPTKIIVPSPTPEPQVASASEVEVDSVDVDLQDLNTQLNDL